MSRLLILFVIALSIHAQTWVEAGTVRLGDNEYTREQYLLDGIPVWGEEAVRFGGLGMASERIELARRERGRALDTAARVRFGSLNEAQAIDRAKAHLGWPNARVEYADRWYKPDAQGKLRAIWRVILTQSISRVERVLVDSTSGEVLERYSLARKQSQGLVFPRSPVSSSLEQLTLPGLQNSPTLTGPTVRVYSYVPVLLGLIPDTAIGTLPSQLARANAQGNFLFPPSDPRFSEVQAYYGISRAANYIRGLGFAGLNRQFDVVVQYIDLESPYDVNAFFSPVLFDNRGGIVMLTNLLAADTTLDSSILFHEYGHATVHAVVNSLNSSIEFDAVNEAYADYIAASFFNNPAIGEFFPYLSPSPNFLTRQSYLRNIENQSFYPDFIQGQPHSDSLMFSAALWDIRRTLGQQRADQIAMNGLARMSAQMGFYSAAQSLISAANSLYGNSVRDQVSQILANRGLTGNTALYSEQSFPLESGAPRVSRIPAKAPSLTLLLAPDDFRISVPLGVSSLRVEVEASAPVRTYIRFRAPVDIENGAVVADYVLGDGRSLNGAITLINTPELQAGQYFFNVANLSNAEVEYAIRVTAVADPAGVAASFPFLATGGSVSGSVPANFLNTRQFRVIVPSGATGLELQLEGDQDVDLYVNFAEPVQQGGEGLPLAEGISASAANTERILLTTATVPNLRPGTYFVAVQNYSRSGSARFTLRANLRTETAYAPSPDTTPPGETRSLFLPASSNTANLLTRQFRIDTQAAWRGLNLRVSTASSVLALVKRGSPVRFANGVPEADQRFLVTNGTRLFALDDSVNPAYQSGPYFVAILSLSERGGTVNFDYTAIQPAATPPVITGIVEGAGFGRQISPGSWITITGTNLAPVTRTWAGPDFVGNALPTRLDGVSVTIGGVPAFVYYISPGQLNVLAPQILRTGTLEVIVTTAAGSSNVLTVNSVAATPSLFRFDPQGRRYAAAVFASGAYSGPVNLFGSALATRPATRGEVVQLFATGLGAVGTVDGVTNEPVVNITPRVTATVGGISARVLFAGRVGGGLYQINLEVPPSTPPGDQAVRISISAVQSDAGVFLAIQ